jgi:MFS family permease
MIGYVCVTYFLLVRSGGTRLFMSSYILKDKSLKRSLNFNILAISIGMVFSTVFGSPVGSPLFTGFMRNLGANDIVYSIVMALPVMGGVFQIAGSYYLELTGKRRFLFFASGFASRLLWIPVAIIPLVFAPAQRSQSIWIITVLITISSVGYYVNNVTVNSWMGDLVPLNIAGRFFSSRSLVSTIISAAAGLLVGAYVDKFNNMLGFAIVFLFGSLFGAGEIITYFRIKHPPVEKCETPPSLYRIIVDPLKDKNYMKLVIFASVFMFGVNIASPFCNVYMIENLKINYTIITFSNQVMSSIATVLFVRQWGKLTDKFGSNPVMRITAFGIVLIPFLWLFVTSSNILMIYISSILTGIAWSGFNIAIFNQSVWLAPQQNRSAYITCYTMLTSIIGTAAAYIAGGYFLQYVGPVIYSLHISFIMHSTLNGYHLLFIISTLFRLIAVIVLLPMVCEKDAKSVKELIQSVCAYIRLNVIRIFTRT